MGNGLKFDTRRRLPMTHKVKCWPTHFKPMASGEKNNSRRRLDRDYRPGDTIVIQEWKPVDEIYTGLELLYIITHIEYGGNFGMAKQFCILSLKPVDKQP
jgi:hypothetical protein